MDAHVDIATESFETVLKDVWNRKTKPLGSLGRLEEIGVKYGLLQKVCYPKVTSPTLLLFAGDHGIVDEGVSAFPKAVTSKMIANFLQGTAAANVMAERVGAQLLVIDCGIDKDLEHQLLLKQKIGYGTKNFLHSSAMTMDEARRAFEQGRELIRTLASKGTNTFLIGEMGIGNSSSAALITHCITSSPIEHVVGRGSGLDDHGLWRKKQILAAARARVKYQLFSPWEILAEFGGFEIATMVGAFSGCLEFGCMAVADGFISGAAAMLAAALNRNVLNAILWSHRSEEPGHAFVLNYVGETPLLSLNLRLGEGTGALLCLPLIQCAVDLMEKMATMAEFAITPCEKEESDGRDGD